MKNCLERVHSEVIVLAQMDNTIDKETSESSSSCSYGFYSKS